MPGDEWQKFANLRLMYSYMFTHPGAKLLFMGDEFAQTTEWNYKSELDWGLLQFDCHKMMKECVKDLNRIYKDLPALHERQFEIGGFEWVDVSHRQEGVIAFKRCGKKVEDDVLIVLNMTPIVRINWKLRVYGKSTWKEVFNSDEKKYWGTGDVFNPDPEIKIIENKSSLYEINLHLPALACIVLH
jgi:1,4-alpha-glucan branching enzyme